MKPLFSTEEVHPRDRFAYWHNVACRRIVKHDSRPQSRREFHAALQSGALAGMEFLLFENAPMRVERTSSHIALEAHDDLFVLRQMSGTLVLEQDGRETTLDPGEMALIDSTRPYSGKFFGGSELLLVKAPRRVLEARVGNTRPLLARRLRPLEAESGLASSYLAALPQLLERLQPANHCMIEDQLLDLVAVALAKGAEAQRPKVSSARGLAVASLRAAIEARLTDPSLDSATAAAAAGISVRYANSILAQEGTSIMRLVQSRRLERCRQALLNPDQAHRTLTDIAFGWGFSDMTHFARRFKTTYGLSPSDYRRTAGAGVSGAVAAATRSDQT